MAQGRGNANGATLIMISALVLILIHTEMANAATIYQVGDANGWGFSVTSWTNGKRFRAGDILTFNYNKMYHNVIKVDEKSYNACKTPRGARVFQTGKDQIRLTKGKNFFICNFTGHCESGMKITVTAA